MRTKEEAATSHSHHDSRLSRACCHSFEDGGRQLNISKRLRVQLIRVERHRETHVSYSFRAVRKLEGDVFCLTHDKSFLEGIDYKHVCQRLPPRCSQGVLTSSVLLYLGEHVVRSNQSSRTQNTSDPPSRRDRLEFQSARRQLPAHRFRFSATSAEKTF